MIKNQLGFVRGLDRFDLNLLAALNVLLEERSVTRAAQRLNLTQPAMSAALRRLRDSFNDELLVTHGKKMVPTPHAQSLAPMVAQMISAAQSLIASSTLFDPATSHRAFRIAASDYISAILLRPLLGEIASIAPKVRIEIVPVGSEIDDAMERGAIDCAISPEQFQRPGEPQELLFTERLNEVRSSTSWSRMRCSVCTSSCSSVFNSTNRMVGRVAASPIASASRSSFSCALT